MVSPLQSARGMKTTTSIVFVALALGACAIDDPSIDSPVPDDEGAFEQESGCSNVLRVGTTIKSGGAIKGSGGFSNCGGKYYSINVYLQWSGQHGQVTQAGTAAPRGGGWDFSAPDARCRIGTWYTGVLGVCNAGWCAHGFEELKSNTLTVTSC